MGVLFLAKDIRLASVLWLRRMLEGLGDDITRLASEAPIPEQAAARYRGVQVPGARPNLAWRAGHRLGWIGPPPASKPAIQWLTEEVSRADVANVLVHYGTLAVRYRRVWESTGKPVFVHCHGYDVTWDMRVAGKPHRRVHSRNYTLLLRRLPACVHFIANSRATQRRLEEIGIAPQRITVKYLGVPVSDTPPPQRPDRRPVTILYLGRLVDFKGPDRVIQAFELACRRGLDGRLVIAGDGPLQQLCKKRRAASHFRDRIKLLGAVAAKQGEELRHQADLFTAHSQTGPDTRQEEAFGVGFVEAMADGLPVVTGRNGSLPEIVRDGEDGILFEPGDVAAHADALLELAGDHRRRCRMGLAGWLRARDCFTLDREMAQLREILNLPPRTESASGSLSGSTRAG